jgi:hypothetical protein
MKFNNNLWAIPTAIAMSSGCLIGGAYGGYEGFIHSQKKRLVENHVDTIAGMTIGACYGVFLGATWPVSVPLLCYRNINDIPLDGKK